MISLSYIRSPSHKSSGHPEGPHRFQSIKDQLNKHLPDNINWVKPDPVDAQTLELVHPASYVQFIQSKASQGPGIVDYGDTYVTGSSFEDALNAISGTLTLLDLILEGNSKKGFAIVRPPGHHASNQKAMGFCLFNNIAIAARRAQEQGMQRVAIVDFDVHHGNGTQDIFYNDPDVLYISTHQWGIFPGSGSKNEIGQAPGVGATINIPLPAGVGDSGFATAYTKLVIPALHRFKPELLLVSAGYDAHFRDPLAGLQVTTEGYYHLTRELVSFADECCSGRLLMVLEGGYNPEALSRSIRNSCLALCHHQSITEVDREPQLSEPDINDLVNQLGELHRL